MSPVPVAKYPEAQVAHCKKLSSSRPYRGLRGQISWGSASDWQRHELHFNTKVQYSKQEFVHPFVYSFTKTTPYNVDESPFKKDINVVQKQC